MLSHTATHWTHYTLDKLHTATHYISMLHTATQWSAGAACGQHVSKVLDPRLGVQNKATQQKVGGLIQCLILV